MCQQGVKSSTRSELGQIDQTNHKYITNLNKLIVVNIITNSPNTFWQTFVSSAIIRIITTPVTQVLKEQNKSLRSIPPKSTSRIETITGFKYTNGFGVKKP